MDHSQMIECMALARSEAIPGPFKHPEDLGEGNVWGEGDVWPRRPFADAYGVRNLKVYLIDGRMDKHRVAVGIR
jgi:hypothetical protein